MKLSQLLTYAHTHESKVQRETYELSIEQFKLFEENIRKIEKIPNVTDCRQITKGNIQNFLIDTIMNSIHENVLLSQPNDKNEYKILIILNFNWKRTIESYAIGLMNMIVSYKHKQSTAKKFTFSKCIASIENISLDNILPDKTLILLKKYIISKDIVKEDIPSLRQKLNDLFKQKELDDTKIKDIISLLNKKKTNDKIYMNIVIYLKTDEKDDNTQYLVLMMDIAYKTEMYHYVFSTRAEDHSIDLFIEKLQKTDKNPIQKLRSYANKKQLPYFEKSYHVPEEYLWHFFNEYSETTWQDVGRLIYITKQDLDDLPPYSGIFLIQIAICLEHETFHFGLYIPYLKLSVETYIEVLPTFLEIKRKEFFPDKKYQTVVRRHALKPSLGLKEQDSFLIPYIQNERYKIISQNVDKTPTTVDTLPSDLKKDILQWRYIYEKNLKQYFRKYPESIQTFELHPFYKKKMKESLTGSVLPQVQIQKQQHISLPEFQSQQIQERLKKENQTAPKRRQRSTVLPVSIIQSSQKQQQKKQQKKQQIVFDFSSPISVRYVHKDDPRFNPLQNSKLKQRKNFNMENIQQSLSVQLLPRMIMRKAMEGGYTCIILVDVANQKEKLSTYGKQQLIPMEIPPEQRKKPFFVFVEQGDLDPSGKARVVVLEQSVPNVIHISVSCAKKRKDNTITDCYKKQTGQDFTKNPMDDFVLLTLRHTLRSFYYKYMRQLGRNVFSLEKIQKFQDLLAENRYNVISTNQQINIFKKTLYHEMPYTWLVSNDRWRDWKKDILKQQQLQQELQL